VNRVIQLIVPPCVFTWAIGVAIATCALPSGCRRRRAKLAFLGSHFAIRCVLHDGARRFSSRNVPETPANPAACEVSRVRSARRGRGDGRAPPAFVCQRAGGQETMHSPQEIQVGIAHREFRSKARCRRIALPMRPRAEIVFDSSQPRISGRTGCYASVIHGNRSDESSAPREPCGERIAMPWTRAAS